MENATREEDDSEDMDEEDSDDVCDTHYLKYESLDSRLKGH